eukprot:84579-Amphidinium_carterae.1
MLDRTDAAAKPASPRRATSFCSSPVCGTSGQVTILTTASPNFHRSHKTQIFTYINKCEEIAFNGSVQNHERM